jgi:hypothetical protein
MPMRTGIIVAGLMCAIAASANVHAQQSHASQSQTTQTQSPPVPVPCAFPGACAPPSTTTPKADPVKPDPARPDPTRTNSSTANQPATNAQRTIDAPNDVSAPPAPPPQTLTPGAPTEQMLGVQVYPNAQFLQSVDAGRGQRYYLYGTNATYAEIVKYYQGVLRNGGRELIKMPPMQQFDLGRYQDQTMVFQPSVVVKDYVWNNSQGYLFIDGGREQRFKTVIQIVPMLATSGR